MKKILVIDNNIDPPYGCAEIVALLQSQLRELGEAEIFTRRGPDGVLPDSPEGIDGVVISGSKTRINENASWIERQMNFIQDLYKMKVPTLGICYGEQLIARTLVGDDCTGVAARDEFGWVEIEKLPAAAISGVFGKLPERFFSFGFHSDEVFNLPSDRFAVTLRNEACAIQGFELLDAPMWGVQFHPERGLQEGNAGLDRLQKRDANKKILGREIGEKVFNEKIGAAIFRGFLSQIWLLDAN